MSYENNAIKVDQFNYDFNPIANGKITALAISPVDNNRFYVSTEEGAVFYTENGGGSWDRGINNIPNGHYLYGAAILPSKINSDLVFVGGSGYSNPAVLVSEDGGRSFDAISQGLPSTIVFDLDMNEDGSLIFAATEAGPYVYVTVENRWHDINGLDAPRQAYWSVEYLDQENIVRFGTHGRGIWDFNIQQNNVATSEVATLKGKFKVYPNPSSDGHFQLDISLSAPLENGKYEIYNNIGERMVSQSLTRSKQITQSIDLNHYPSGVYHLNIRDHDRQKSIVLIKQ